MNTATIFGRLLTLCLAAGALSACTVPAGRTGTALAAGAAPHAGHHLPGAAKDGCGCCKDKDAAQGAAACMAPGAHAGVAQAIAGAQDASSCCKGMGAAQGAASCMATGMSTPAPGGHGAAMGARGSAAAAAGGGGCCAMPCCGHGGRHGAKQTGAAWRPALAQAALRSVTG